MLALSSNLRYFIATEPTDMRKSFDGLAGIVRNQLQKDPDRELKNLLPQFFDKNLLI